MTYSGSASNTAPSSKRGIPAWKHDEKNYGRHDAIRGLRGHLKLVTRVDPSEVPNPKELALREDKLRKMASVKSDLKRIMSQRNTEKLTLDDWRTIFDETIDEFVVEGVMLS